MHLLASLPRQVRRQLPRTWGPPTAFQPRTWGVNCRVDCRGHFSRDAGAAATFRASFNRSLITFVPDDFASRAAISALSLICNGARYTHTCTCFASQANLEDEQILTSRPDSRQAPKSKVLPSSGKKERKHRWPRSTLTQKNFTSASHDTGHGTGTKEFKV